MKQHVFKRGRTIKGQRIKAKSYSGRYRLDGEVKDTEVALGVTDKQVAESKLAAIVKQAERERQGLAAPLRQVETVSMPLKLVVREWVEDLTAKGRKPHYCYVQEKSMAVLMHECGWGKVSDITPESFIRWRSKNQSSKAAKTLNEYFACVRAFLNWLIKAGRLPSNPLLSVEKVETRGRKERDRRPLTHAEFEKLFEVAPPERRIVYAFAYYTGLRRGEIEDLCWGDFDLENGWVTCPDEHAKNRKSQPLPLSSDLLEMLIQHRNACGQPNDAAKALKLPYRLMAFNRDLKAAGISKKDGRGKIVDFYSFRHSFAQRLKESGTPFAAAMRLMRHSDPKLLASVYGDQDAFALADHIAKLPGMPNGNQWSPDSSPESGFSGHFVAQAVASAPSETPPQETLNELIRRLLSHLGGGGQMEPAVGLEPTTC